MTIAALAGGWQIFMGVIIVFLFATVYGIYTTKGSGIAERPYGKIYGGAPGAKGSSSASGHDGREHNWSRGTR